MNWKQWTAAVIISGVAGWIIWDFVVVGAAPANVDATISQIILEWAYDWPALPWAVGVLCGHWFWPRYVYSSLDRSTWRYWVLGLLAVAAMAVDIVWLDRVFPLLPFMLGIPIGYLLWPQRLRA
jgi:hypothetical protein